jgi:hypothetical protein
LAGFSLKNQVFSRFMKREATPNEKGAQSSMKRELKAQ